MKHVLVESSHIKSVAYESLGKVLEITFKTGNTYRYEGVSGSLYKGLMESPSKGSFIHGNLKEYPATRVTEPFDEAVAVLPEQKDLFDSEEAE